MAPLKFSRVVSFSSEEPSHPATGLLGKVRDLFYRTFGLLLCQGKWLCRDEGEKEAWVILQLEDTSVITDIDLGNSGASFIELQVS